MLRLARVRADAALAQQAREVRDDLVILMKPGAESRATLPSFALATRASASA
jgi:hypothetical protein